MQQGPIDTTDKSLAKWLHSALDCEAAGHYGQAHRLLEHCRALARTTAASQTEREVIHAGLWRLSPLWWANLQHGGLHLRRCGADDAGFYSQCYGDPVFVSQFNRQRPWRGDLASALKKSGALPPLQTHLLMWVVESSTQGQYRPIGLASLSSIDTQNLRTELSIGLPGVVPPTLGIKATLMMLHFALVMMPFNKVYTYVYQDNPQALHNALRLGFTHEGMLKDHFNIPGHGFVSVELTGLTRAQLHGNAYLRLLAKRKIGQVW